MCVCYWIIIITEDGRYYRTFGFYNRDGGVVEESSSIIECERVSLVCIDGEVNNHGEGFLEMRTERWIGIYMPQEWLTKVIDNGVWAHSSSVQIEPNRAVWSLLEGKTSSGEAADQCCGDSQKKALVRDTSMQDRARTLGRNEESTRG